MTTTPSPPHRQDRGSSNSSVEKRWGFEPQFRERRDGLMNPREVRTRVRRVRVRGSGRQQLHKYMGEVISVSNFIRGVTSPLACRSLRASYNEPSPTLDTGRLTIRHPTKKNRCTPTSLTRFPRTFAFAHLVNKFVRILQERVHGL